MEIARHEVELDSTMAEIRIDWNWWTSALWRDCREVSRNCGSLAQGQRTEIND